MNEKRLWLVALTITGDGNYINTSQCQYCTETEARDSLAAFKQRCIKEGDSSVPSYMLSVDGAVMKVNDDFVEGDEVGKADGVHKYIPTGGLFHGVMESYDFDPEELLDAKRAFTVSVQVVRTNNFDVEIEEAESESDAEDQARDMINEGECGSDLDYPDDMEIDVESCYES